MKSIVKRKTIKMWATVIAVSLFFIACSKDDVPATTNKRPVKIDGAFNSGYNFTNPITYNGKLLKSYKSIGEGIATVNVSYNATNKITNITFVGNDWQSTITYQYTNKGNIASITDSWGKTTFTYNTNGTVQVIAKNFDENGNETDSRTSILTLENEMLKSVSYQNNSGQYFKESFSYDTNNNLIAVTEQSDSTNGINFSTSATYNITYDDKINPTYAILNDSNALNKGGWSLYSFHHGFNGLKVSYEVYLGGNHSIFFYGKNNYTTNERYSNISYNYTYDDAGYPTELIETNNSRNVKFNYTYENY